MTGVYKFGPLAGYTGVPIALVPPTLCYLRRCQAARARGAAVSYTTDAAWLVHQAINRRAGWLDDPVARGSCIPVKGRYPRKASGDRYWHLRRLARSINTPRLIVRVGELGEWRKLIRSRIPWRIEDTD